MSSTKRGHCSFRKLIPFLPTLFPAFCLIFLLIGLQSPLGNASPPGIIFDDVIGPDAAGEEDYGTLLLTNEQREQQAANQAKPDDVDNEVIQSLVDNFLNKGTAVVSEMKKEAGSPNEPQKLNKDAQALINSSDFWRTQNLEPPNSISDPARTQGWLAGYSAQLQRVLQQMALAGWNYFTAASYSTKQYLDEAEEVGRAFLRASAQQAAQFNASAFAYGSPERVQLSVLAQQGMNALGQSELMEFSRLLFGINQQFTHTQLCGKPGKAPMGGDKTACLLKFADIPALLNGPSADAQQCLELWQKWRISAGQNLTASYAQLVELSNKGARLNGFPDAGAQWRAVYELPAQFGFFPERQLDIGQQLDILHAQMAPLYEQLMAYFRPRLASIHAKKGSEENQKAGQVSRDGPLPVHLLKSLNGDSWSAYYELTKPFGEEMPAEEQKIANELVDAFHAQNYTVRVMFARVYRFMKYVGFERLPKSFWTNSIFTRNWAKDMICNPATAYDMMDGHDDYRIKVCGQLTEQDFVNAHRLLAKLFYQYGSRKQPILLRDAPNPSLSSALAGAFTILALNPEYLRAQKLIGAQTERSGPAEINRLYKEAMEEIVKLPFAIVADKWRYAVFEGKLNPSNWSQEWWTLRQKYQGIRPPSMADPKAVEFDAVSSPAITQFHAPATRDALAYIAQFQVLKKLCGGIDKLSQGCLPTKSAFDSVHEAIAQGGSIPWISAFEKLTGSKQIDAGPMLEYFEPLMEWLKNTNKNEQRVLGWPNPKGDPFPEAELPELHNEYHNENQNQQWAGGDSGLGLGSDGSGERIAFPGQKCEKGQECLLDSQCNGTICVCREGLYTLKIADSYNCVPGDPAKVGFTNDNGGLVIALNDRDGANNETKAAGAAEENGHKEEMERKVPSNGANAENGHHHMDMASDGAAGGKKSKANGTASTSRPFGWTFLLALAMLLIGLISIH